MIHTVQLIIMSIAGIALVLAIIATAIESIREIKGVRKNVK